MTSVSVVIPTLNAGAAFAATLAAVRHQQGVGEVDLVVVDSASDDETVELARRAGARVRTILRATFNHGVTRNLGAALGRGELVAFLTQDALPANDRWLANLCESLEQEGAAGAYSRVLPRPDCSPLVLRKVRSDLVFATERRVKRASSAAIDAMAPFERRVFFHFNNVASLVRRCVLQRIPFPEIPFGEDLAWGGRVLREGEALVYEPRSLVMHSHASRLRTDFARHREDAILMRTLFGFRNRDGLHDCVPAWWHEVRADAAFLRRHAGAAERLRYLPYSLVLRACQIAGQWAGSHAPLLQPPRFAAGLPAIEGSGAQAPAR